MARTVLITSNTSWYLLKFRKGTIQRLLAEGYHVVCLAPEDAYSVKLEELGAEFIAVPLEGKSIGPLLELKSLLAIYCIVRKLKPAFVYNHTIKMNLYVGLSCRLLDVPYSNNVSGLGTVFLHKGLAYRLAQKLYGYTNSGAKTVFLQNEEDRDTFLELKLVTEDKAVLLPGSGIDLNAYAFSPVPETKPFTFIMIARLIADKGVREYVDAARTVIAVCTTDENLRFILVGPGGISNASAIGDDEVARWNTQGVVEYVGNQDDVIPWIEQSHVLVLPSYREGMPRTVLEAASIGRPAIVTDVPGCRQSVVDGETGWYCEVRDVESLAVSMLRVVDLPREELERFGVRARHRVEERFSEELVISRYLECLSL
jgi:glycosyltransferase involved in cell wall biosynthesis